MKTLNNYINEWKATNDTLSSIEKTYVYYKKYFVYEIKKKSNINIFNFEWPQLFLYTSKVYINDEKVDLDSAGYTDKKYDPGTYFIKIDDINNITNHKWMFWGCNTLISVPFFDTKNSKSMEGMFYNCTNLKDVPLLHTAGINTAWLFKKCKNLSFETRLRWRFAYNFETDNDDD